MKSLPLNPKAAGTALHMALLDRERDGLRMLDAQDALSVYLGEVGNIRHFSAREVAHTRTSGGVRNKPPSPLIWQNIVPTLHVLEWLRQELGNVPITVTSGFRSSEYNRAVGGASASLHTRFSAIDFTVSGFSTGHIADVLEGHTDSHLFGVGTYDGFNHLDTRGLLGLTAPARWDERRKAA